jgi:hypothetical protein
VLVGLVFAAPSAARPTADEERVRTLLERDGFATQIRNTPILAARQVMSGFGGDTGAPTLSFTQLFARSFAPETLLQGVVDALREEYPAEQVEAAIAFYETPPGSEISAAIAATESRGGRAQRAAYRRRIRVERPSPRRSRAIRAIDEATGESATRIEVTVAMTVSVIRAIDRLVEFERSGVEAEPGWMQDAVRSRLEASVREQAQANLLFATRTLSHGELLEFVRFAQSDAVRGYAKIAHAAYARGVRAAAEAFDDRFGEWLAQQDPPALREAAREDGRRFGSGRKGELCLREAFRRERHCRDVACQAVVADFLDACLASGLRTPELCAERPCAERRRGDRFCRNLTRTLEARCAAPEPATPG